MTFRPLSAVMSSAFSSPYSARTRASGDRAASRMKMKLGPVRRTGNKSFLATAELRLFLLQEGLIADSEILGLEAGVALLPLGLPQRTWIEKPTGELLVPAGNQRCAFGDPFRGRQRLCLEFLIGNHPRHQPHGEGFLGAEYVAFQENP